MNCMALRFSKSMWDTELEEPVWLVPFTVDLVIKGVVMDTWVIFLHRMVFGVEEQGGQASKAAHHAQMVDFISIKL